mmetsp:Transcript_3088/g.5725  ORF Transcript_3088/g.5725 Transcript_3088/m.5725 type:complete len:237 (-) Transcript_3088:44-754(-)
MIRLASAKVSNIDAMLTDMLIKSGLSSIPTEAACLDETPIFCDEVLNLTLVFLGGLLGVRLLRGEVEENRDFFGVEKLPSASSAAFSMAHPGNRMESSHWQRRTASSLECSAKAFECFITSFQTCLTFLLFWTAATNLFISFLKYSTSPANGKFHPFDWDSASTISSFTELMLSLSFWASESPDLADSSSFIKSADPNSLSSSMYSSSSPELSSGLGPESLDIDTSIIIYPSKAAR